MTIAAQTTNRTSATGNGVTTSFSFPYPFTAQADLVVQLVLVASPFTATTKALTTDYTITGTADAQGRYGSGGNVVFSTAPSSLYNVVIYADPSIAQGLDLVENDPLPVEQVELGLDKLTLMVRRLADRIARCWRLPDSSVSTGTLTVEPVASQYLGFDASGNLITIAGQSTTVVSTFMATVVDDTTAGAAVKTMTDALTVDALPDKTADYVWTYDASAAGGKKILLQDAPLPRMAISGLTYAMGDGAGGGDQTNDITVAVGSARDSTDATNIFLTSAITKQLDATWAVGTNAGGLDTGSIGNSDYYIWLIKRSDTGVKDVLFSLSSTAPTMPTNYDYKRLIGWIKRASAAIVGFDTYEHDGGGLELHWRAPRLDADLSNTLTTSRRTDALSVPLGFTTLAHVRTLWFDASFGFNGLISCPDETDAAPSTSGTPGVTVIPVANVTAFWEGFVRTSAAGLVASRATLATVDVYRIFTAGFRWSRRN